GLILASAGGVAGVPTVAKIAKGAVIVIALFMALQQVGVAEEIVTAAFTLILGAVALAVGLAFGLGNRDLAGEITRRWYEEGRRRDRRRTDRPGPNTPPGDEPPILDWVRRGAGRRLRKLDPPDRSLPVGLLDGAVHRARRAEARQRRTLG